MSNNVIEHTIKVQTTQRGAKVFFDGKEQNLMERFVLDKTLEGIPGVILNFKNLQKNYNIKDEEIIEEHEIKLEITEEQTSIYLDQNLIMVEKKFTINEPMTTIPFWFKNGKIIKSSELQPKDLCNIR